MQKKNKIWRFFKLPNKIFVLINSKSNKTVWGVAKTQKECEF